MSEEGFPPDVSGDAAAFALRPGAKVTVLPLAEGAPSRGDWLWLVGDVAAREPQQERLFPGYVVIASRRGALVKFREPFSLQAFSGAPLVNRQGEVAGILIGGGLNAAFVNHAGSIRRLLAQRQPQPQ
jgi:hypothetical protein